MITNKMTCATSFNTNALTSVASSTASTTNASNVTAHITPLIIIATAGTTLLLLIVSFSYSAIT